ncbi:hypothetical protein ACU674_001352 [Klebsiella quasipneumoniae]
MILTEGQLLFRLQDFQGAEKDALAIGDYEFAQESADIACALRELLQARRTIQELTAVVEQRNGECVRLHSELKSRTVKLTDINEYLAEVHDKTLNRAFRLLAEGVRAGDVAAMRAAGIKVEAE